ncbi:tetratricopeptide repeat protein [Flavobacterium sp. RSSA_27]|uniref:tetratricopeptide repeat protein n=1 Tax=Flavobacterium sp. RSSA_27 TaxID=3447667 RepID=UPI003F2D42F7
MKLITIILEILLLFNSFILNSRVIFQINKEKNDSLINDENEKRYSHIYEVTEKINMNFGASKITYTVSNSNLINKYDLGPNNSRTIKVRTLVSKISQLKKIATFSFNNTSFLNTQSSNIKTYQHDESIYIDPLETFERLSNNGITSIEIYKKLGDSYFYKNDYAEAIKYYSALIKVATKLEAEYYFRYGQSLKKVGQLEKSNEILEKYKKIIAGQEN